MQNHVHEVQYVNSNRVNINSRTSSPLRDPFFKKINKTEVLCKLRIFLYVYFLGCKSPPNDVNYFSDDKSRCYACSRHRVHNTGRLSSNYEIHTRQILSLAHNPRYVQ